MRERERATVTMFFYLFFDHVTKPNVRHSNGPISRPPMYTHVVLQALINISSSVFRDVSSVTKIGLGQKSTSLIILDLTSLHLTLLKLCFLLVLILCVFCRYNNYEEDPLSRCDGCDPAQNGENSISARSDLNPANGSYPFGALRQRPHGGTDMKVCS